MDNLIKIMKNETMPMMIKDIERTMSREKD